jgi:purine-binding chemotaxis protein CheW
VIFDASTEGEKLELGLMVDAVSEVIDIRESQIEPAPQFGATIRRDFIRGMAKVDGDFIVILEPERALDIDEMAQLSEQTQAV